MLHQYAQILLGLAGWQPQPAPSSHVTDPLPTVDLGYALYKPSFHNLRFRAPEAPLDEREAGIQDAPTGYNCPQFLTAWVVTVAEDGTPLNKTGNVTYEIPPHAADENEDCLFLDIVMPESVMPITGAKPAGSGAPVLVWIYGGGYIMGSKSYWGNPSGLIAHNRATGREGLIFVSFNYRLGALGWLAGPSVESDGTANAALHDQRMALDWVQKYIHLFGGDPDRVTVMGESAGGGCIITHITAYGGASSQKTPFRTAIIQSPGLLPPATHDEAETYYDRFLDALDVTSLAEARQKSSEALIRANDEVLFTAPFGSFLFGPAIDDGYIPDALAKLLSAGKFGKDLSIILGHRPNEGHQFTPDLSAEEEVHDFLSSFFPHADSDTVTHLRTVLYPPVYDGTLPYTTMRGRLDLIYSESVFTCHTSQLARVFGNKTYNYRYNNSLGLHTDDVGPTFMNGNESWGWEGIVNQTQASMLQEYITAFVVDGTPNAAKQVSQFPIYGNEASLLVLSPEGHRVETDPNVNERCKWWNKGVI